MIALSPVPIWYRISDIAKVKLWDYQMNKYGFYLEIPQFPGDFRPITFEPIILTTEEADRLMRQRPRHPKRVK